MQCKTTVGAARLPLRVHNMHRSNRRSIEILTVACNVDGVVVPVGATDRRHTGHRRRHCQDVDLLVHPAVVAACQALNGVPVSVTPAGRQRSVPAKATDCCKLISAPALPCDLLTLC